jgi:hypothetical protein
VVPTTGGVARRITFDGAAKRDHRWTPRAGEIGGDACAKCTGSGSGAEATSRAGANVGAGVGGTLDRFRAITAPGVTAAKPLSSGIPDASADSSQISRSPAL